MRPPPPTAEARAQPRRDEGVGAGRVQPGGAQEGPGRLGQGRVGGLKPSGSRESEQASQDPVQRGVVARPGDDQE